MPEYIERADLLKTAKEFAQNFSSSCFATPHIIKAIENAPKVDVVEVVRCKDCIQRRYHCFGQYYCQRYLFKCKENDFCSYGEREEGAEE